MRYLLCYVFPPAVPLLCGKPFSAIINAFLCLFFWMPGVWHAKWILNQHLANGRTKRTVKAINQPEWVNRVFPAQPKQLPPAKKQQALDVQDSGEYNNPTVGVNGTRFRLKA